MEFNFWLLCFVKRLSGFGEGGGRGKSVNLVRSFFLIQSGNPCPHLWDISIDFEKNCKIPMQWMDRLA